MAIAFVNSASVYNGTATTTTVTAAQNVTGGNALVLLVNTEAGGALTITGVTDTAGSTWSKSVAVTNITGAGSAECWYCVNVTGNAANQVTATWSGSNGPNAAICLQYSGAQGGFDVAVSGSNASAVTNVISSSFTPAGAGELVVLGTVSGNSGGVVTYQSGYVQRDDSNYVSNDGYAEDRVSCLAGAQTAGFTTTVAQPYALVGVVLKPTAAPDTPGISTGQGGGLIQIVQPFDKSYTVVPPSGQQGITTTTLRIYVDGVLYTTVADIEAKFTVPCFYLPLGEHNIAATTQVTGQIESALSTSQRVSIYDEEEGYFMPAHTVNESTVTVSSTVATRIDPGANANRYMIRVVNMDPTDRVYVGYSNSVSIGTGQVLEPDFGVGDFFIDYNVQLWAQAAAGTANVRVYEYVHA